MDWLKTRLKELGKTGADFARALGVAKSRVYEMYAGKRQIQADEIEIAARFLEWNESDLLARISGRTGDVHKSDIEGRKPLRRDSAPLPTLIMWKSAVGGSSRGGAFMLNSAKGGEVERPDFLEFFEKAFATKVVTSDNEPVYKPRDTLLVNPEETPVDGDDCVFTGTSNGEGWSAALIGCLVRSTPTLWTIRQYAHSQDRELSRSDWPNAWRIVGRHHR